ncbi:MAG: hypothetical protein ACYCZF_01815 [Anaerolineae bacterium]
MREHIGKLLCGVILLSIIVGCSGLPSTNNNLPTPQPTPRVLEVTLADSGRKIELCRYEQIKLRLGEGYDWTITIPDEAVFSRVLNNPVEGGMQGLYTAHKLGQTSLEAVGDPTCRQSDPPCGAPSLSYKLIISVVLSPNMFGSY